MNRPAAAWLSAALIGLVAVVHAPALSGTFLWDDDDHLTQNAAVAAPDGLQQIWSSLKVSRYYPLTLTSFWVQRQLWGLRPLPFHLVSLAFHAGGAVLVFLLLRRLSPPGAWLAAALWAVHPVNVESVAWITELKNTQSGFFFFAALLCYDQFEDQARPHWYALAWLAFAAALLSKPSTVMLPAVLLLWIWWRRGSWSWRDLLRVAPFAALSAAMSLLTVTEQNLHIQNEPGTTWSLSLAQRLMLAGQALWFYAAKLFWPIPVMFVYPRWPLNPARLLGWLPLLALLGLALLLWRARRQPWARGGLLGLGSFAILLAPVLGFFNIYYFRYSYVADHFDYLASAALIATVVAGAGRIIQLTSPIVAAPIGAARPVTLPFTIGIASVLAAGTLSWQHSRHFRSNEALWLDTLRKNPNATLAHTNLARIYLDRGELGLATDHLQAALRLDPDFPPGHVNLGTVLAQQGKTDEAISQFREAIRLQPRSPEALADLARALVTTGQLADACTNLLALVALTPQDADAWLQLGELQQRQHQFAAALQTYQRASASLPGQLHLANEWAWLLATCPEPSLRNPSAAIQLATQLVDRTRRRVLEALDTLAAAYASAGRFDEAIATARTAGSLASQQNASARAAAINARVTLYEHHQPFVASVP